MTIPEIGLKIHVEFLLKCSSLALRRQDTKWFDCMIYRRLRYFVFVFRLAIIIARIPLIFIDLGCWGYQCRHRRLGIWLRCYRSDFSYAILVNLFVLESIRFINQIIMFSSSEATSLTHLTRKVPSKRYERLIVTMDLHKIKKQYPEWTHVLLRVRPTSKPVRENLNRLMVENIDCLFHPFSFNWT